MKQSMAVLSLLFLMGCSRAGDNWLSYRSEKWGFEARFPVAPKEESQTVELAGKTVPLYLVSASQDGWDYAVSYFDCPLGVTYDESKGIAGMAQGLKATVVWEKDSSVAGKETLVGARAFQLASGDRLIDGKVLLNRDATKNPCRVFQIMVGHPKVAKKTNLEVFNHYLEIATH